MIISVIGLGYWGPNLVRNFEINNNIKTKYIYDLDKKKCEHIKNLYPSIIIADNYQQILDDTDVDSVCIVTPVKTHYKLAKLALNANKHVLIEKPLTDNSKEAIQLINYAIERNLTLMCDHTFCYHPVVSYIKNYVINNDVGDMLYFDSVRINLGLFRSDTDVIWDLAPHDISIFLYLFDNIKIEYVSAVASDLTKTGHENISYITLFLDNGKVCHFHLNWLSPVKVRTLIIGFTKKMLVWNDNLPDETLKIYDKGIDIDNRDKNNILVSYRNDGIYIPKITKEEALSSMIKDFYNTVNCGTIPKSNNKISLTVIKVIEAIKESCKNNGTKIKVVHQMS